MGVAKVFDVVVIGAGPAGCTAACRLAQLGHSVALIEKQAFPREHVGESIPRSVLPLLHVIEADQCISEAGFLQTHSSLIRWTTRAGTILRDAEGEPHFQVQRALFDQLLLEHAKRNGVKVFQPAEAHVRLDDEGKWHTQIKRSGQEFVSPVLLDASGRQVMYGKRKRYSPPTLAVVGYLKEKIQNKAQVSRVEALDNGWLWCAPLANGFVATAAFIDSKWFKHQNGKSLTSVLFEQFAQSHLFQHFLDCPLQSSVRAYDVSVLAAEQTMTQGLIRVGDAALSMDPLSSQGGLMAIASSLQAALLANTLLRYPERRELAERFSEITQFERLQHHLQTLAAFYREKHDETDTSFWRSRADIMPTENLRAPLSSILNRLAVAEKASLRPAPVLAGDVIVEMMALNHPSLEAPIAFVSGSNITGLLKCFNDNPNAGQLLERWSAQIGEPATVKLFSKLWQKRVIVEYDAK